MVCFVCVLCEFVCVFVFLRVRVCVSACVCLCARMFVRSCDRVSKYLCVWGVCVFALSRPCLLACSRVSV